MPAADSAEIDPAILDLTKAFVLEKMIESSRADADVQLQIITELAELILGDGHREALVAYAERQRENLNLMHAQAAIQKRETEEQVARNLAQIDVVVAAFGEVTPDDGAGDTP